MKMDVAPRILAFDTSAAHCAAALLSREKIVASRHEEMGRGQAERLFPMMEEVLAEAGLSWSDLDAIGVGVGPGNFTGIRIAVSAARGLALSLAIPAVAVSSFEVMLAQAGRVNGDILVSLEAPRGQHYLQRFENRVAKGEPSLWSGDADDLPSGLEAVGFDAVRIAKATGGTPNEIWGIADHAHHVARIAAARLRSGALTGRPTPLYVRPADAAPSTEPSPVILP